MYVCALFPVIICITVTITTIYKKLLSPPSPSPFPLSLQSRQQASLSLSLSLSFLPFFVQSPFLLLPQMLLSALQWGSPAFLAPSPPCDCFFAPHMPTAGISAQPSIQLSTCPLSIPLHSLLPFSPPCSTLFYPITRGYSRFPVMHVTTTLHSLLFSDCPSGTKHEEPAHQASVIHSLSWKDCSV